MRQGCPVSGDLGSSIKRIVMRVDVAPVFELYSVARLIVEKYLRAPYLHQPLPDLQYEHAKRDR